MTMKHVLAMSVLIVIGAITIAGTIYNRTLVVNELAEPQQQTVSVEQQSPPAEEQPIESSMLSRLMLNILAPGLEKEISESISESLATYLEEVSLRIMLFYYDYSTISRDDGTPISPPESLQPLDDIIAQFSAEQPPRLAPLASVFYFHYPTSEWELTGDDSDVEFFQVPPKSRIDQKGIPKTVVHISKRNNIAGDIRSADCYLMLQIYSGESKQAPQVVWLHCEFQWDHESESWKLMSSRQLQEDEDFSLTDD